TFTDGSAGSSLGSRGIYLFRYDTKTAHFTPLGLTAEMRNPAWLTTDSQYRFLYAVDNTSGAKCTINSYKIDPTTASLRLLNKVDGEGTNPAHVAGDDTGRMLIDANYETGSVASWALKPDGSIGERTSFDQHKGSSVGPRQKGPHPHAV